MNKIGTHVHMFLYTRPHVDKKYTILPNRTFEKFHKIKLMFRNF